MANECIFCKIAAGELPADIVYEDEQITAFNDVNPQAPIHILVIPNRHIADVAEAEDTELLGQLVQVATKIADDEGIGTPDQGYRLVMNYGSRGGLTVHHLHVHLIGGRVMRWPPG